MSTALPIPPAANRRTSCCRICARRWWSTSCRPTALSQSVCGCAAMARCSSRCPRRRAGGWKSVSASTEPMLQPLVRAEAWDDPAAVLRRVFGFPGFRGQQEQVVRHVVAGGDALVLAPTGGGKSICFQVPALCRAGTAVVVSPLIALMDDQVAALRQLGVAAGALHSDLDPAEARSVARDLIEQQLDLLYVSPERLLGNGTMERLSRLPLALFAIDEAP